jgi:hypothetical protein
MKKLSILFLLCICSFLVTAQQENAKSAERPRFAKNYLGFELFGAPGNISFEHRFYQSKKYQFHGGIGANIFTLALTRGFPGLYLSANHRWALTQKWGVMVQQRFDVLVPVASLRSICASNGTPAKISLSILDAGFSAGFIYTSKRWEVLFPAPWILYGIVQYSDGEEPINKTGGFFSIASRVYYRF